MRPNHESNCSGQLRTRRSEGKKREKGSPLTYQTPSQLCTKALWRRLCNPTKPHCLTRPCPLHVGRQLPGPAAPQPALTYHFLQFRALTAVLTPVLLGSPWLRCDAPLRAPLRKIRKAEKASSRPVHSSDRHGDKSSRSRVL